MEDWHLWLRHSSCRFTDEYREDLFHKQIKKSTVMTHILTYYNYRKMFEGEVASYSKPCGLVETQLEEEERCQKAKADLLGSTKITGLVSTATGTFPGSKSVVHKLWKKDGKCPYGAKCNHHQSDAEKGPAAGGNGGGKRSPS